MPTRTRNMKHTHKGTALITGGAKRIGKAIALRLADAGYNIALHYNHSQQEAERLAEEIRQRGKKCGVYPCDLQSISGIQPMIERIFADFSDCNVLINNASVFERYNFVETTEAVFDKHFAVNVKSPFFLIQYFAKHCKNGQVINVLDSYTSKHTSPYFAYLLSKKSLESLTAMAAVALGPNIRVNGIAPGLTELSHEVEPALVAKKQQTLPLRHVVTVAELADAVMQLLHSPYLTGQVLKVDGGEHLL